MATKRKVQPPGPEPTIDEVLSKLQDRERDEQVVAKEERGEDSVLNEDLALIVQAVAKEEISPEGLAQDLENERQ